MERKIAEKIVSELAKSNGPKLSIFEAMSMVKVPTDNYETYAIQIGDVTFVAWVHPDESVSTKILCW